MASLDVRINPGGARAGGQVVRRELRAIQGEARATGAAATRHVGGDFRTAGQIASRAIGGIRSALRSVGGIVGGLVGFVGVTSLVVAVRSGQAAATRFEGALQDLSAITGATGKDLEFFTQAAREMGATTTFSAAQAAEAFTLIASAKPDLLDNAEALKQVTQESLSLAEAAGLTLPQAADVLGISLNQFGLAADQAGRVINVLAAGAKFGSSQIQDTAAALKNAGVTAQTAGVSFETMNAAIQVLASVGLRAAEAGTGVRNILLILENQAESFRPSVVGLSQALVNLGNENFTTSQKAKLFGRENINAFNALSQRIPLLNQLERNITGTGIAYEQAAIRVNDLEGDLAALNSAWEELNIAIRDTESLRSTVQSLTDLFRILAENIVRISELQEEGFVPSTQFDYLVQSLTDYDDRLQQLTQTLQDLKDERDSVVSTSGEDLISIQGLESQIAALRASAEELEILRALQVYGAGPGQRVIIDELNEIGFKITELELDYISLGQARRDSLALDPSGRSSIDLEADQNRIREAIADLESLREQSRGRLEDSGSTAQVESYTGSIRTLEEAIGSLAQQRDRLINQSAIDNASNLDRIDEEILGVNSRILELQASQIEATRQDNWTMVTEAVTGYKDAVTRLSEAQREAAATAAALEQAVAPPTQEELDPLSRLRGLNTLQLLRRARSLLSEIRTPEETLEVERQRIQLFQERGVLTEEQAVRARRLAQEQFEADTRGVESGRSLVEVRRSLVDALLPLQAAQDRYAERVSEIDLLERNLQQLNLTDIDIIRLRIYAAKELTDALDDQSASTREVDNVTQNVIQRYLPAQAAQQRYEQALKDIASANLSVIDTEMAKSVALREYVRAVDQAQSGLNDLERQTLEITSTIREEFAGLSGDISTQLAGAFLGAETDLDNFLRRIAQRIVAAQLEQSVVGPIGGFLQSFFGSLFSGFSPFGSSGGVGSNEFRAYGPGQRQFGGSTRAGRSYIVGEAGPELLTQGARGGFVTPLSGGRGSGLTVNVYNTSNEQVDVGGAQTGPDGEQTLDIVVGTAIDRLSASGELDDSLGLYGTSRALIPRG